MYIGPEVLMPVASALAAVAGVVLMFWRRTVAVVKACGRFVKGAFSPRSSEQ